MKLWIVFECSKEQQDGHTNTNKGKNTHHDGSIFESKVMPQQNVLNQASNRNNFCTSLKQNIKTKKQCDYNVIHPSIDNLHEYPSFHKKLSEPQTLLRLFSKTLTSK